MSWRPLGVLTEPLFKNTTSPFWSYFTSKLKPTLLTRTFSLTKEIVARSMKETNMLMWMVFRGQCRRLKKHKNFKKLMTKFGWILRQSNHIQCVYELHLYAVCWVISLFLNQTLNMCNFLFCIEHNSDVSHAMQKDQHNLFEWFAIWTFCPYFRASENVCYF